VDVVAGAEEANQGIYEFTVGHLERVGLRRRRHYDAKRTFISLTRADGARDDVLKRVTQARPKDVFDEYTTFPWSTLCEAVLCLKIGLKEGKVLPLVAVSRLGTGRGTGGIGAASNGPNSPAGPALAIAGKWRGVRDSNCPDPMRVFPGSSRKWPISRVSKEGSTGRVDWLRPI
jgi:hypothetical protein